MTRFLPTVAALALCLAPPAFADEAPQSTASGPEAPTATAKGPAAPTEITDRAEAPAADREPDRRVHGEVMVAVGTGGYRSAGIEVHGPIGDKGEAGILLQTTRESRGRRFAGPGIPLDPARGACVAVGRYDAPVLPVDGAGLDGAAPPPC